jgi:predicted nucleotide-binding protein (sugar kinase/HSP70/actin superfamily)
MVKVMDVQEIEVKTKKYAEQLRKEMGMEKKDRSHFEKPFERPWTKDQKDSTTVLFGGLTLAHEDLITDAMKGLGYNIRSIPCPDNEALAVGKEYGNRGQCNPTYYTVGNLVKYLKELEAQGEKDIEDRYVFVTAGACGPCRFGMYEAEYRQALRDSGFGNFRVLLFQQTGGMDQTKVGAAEAALELNAHFGLTMLRAMIVGDMLNELGYKIRPYEVNKGETDRAMDEAKKIVGDAMREGRSAFLALRRVRKLFAAIEVDHTRVKPKVKITGEFWAQTTEGDGNYGMFRWLESEGAEVLVEPIGTWIEYVMFMFKFRAKHAMKVDKSKKSTIRKLTLAQIAFRAWHNLYRLALGFSTEPLPDQGKLVEYSRAYYNTHLGGGEGHLEVGKNVMATKDKHAHMVVSLKPFGCMPSTMSDGVQSRVVSDYKDAIFLPVETSGDSEVNVKSRVQMKLYEAKMKTRQEFADVLEAHNVTVDQVREYAQKHPKYRESLLKLPHHHGISKASNLVAEVAGKIG